MFSFGKFSTRSFDWPLFLTAVLLTVVGILAIYSVDLSRGFGLELVKKQLIALSIGVAILFFLSISRYTFFRFSAKWWYFFSLILLVAVLFFGKTIRGTTGWFDFGGFSFQPVEFAKVGVILLLAFIVSRFGRRFEKPVFFLGVCFFVFLIIGLVMIQPDLGSAILIGILLFGILWLVGTPKIFLAALAIFVCLAGTISWKYVLQDYQRDRLITFLNPSQDPLGVGYNLNQSIIALGSGKFLGRGLGFGSQSQLRFLPEAQTDFIFSVIGEELGWIGVAAILILYAIIFWRLFLIIRRANDDFISVAVSGVLILFFSQFFINLGAASGLLPITGVTLPFVSYGGSSLIINFLLIGMVESMVAKKY
ncbi:MAG: rod shape-determining protein RodA [Patescibacteria group bacterium]|nr:rod shape-determining protein RodA [Patescibacteria group bacterium]